MKSAPPIVLLALAAAACSGAPIGAQPQPQPQPLAADPGCQVQLRTTISGDADGRSVLVTAHNLTDTPIDLELPSRCPAGPIDLTGLAAGYDYYGTCTMGMCGDTSPIAIHLDPGGEMNVAAASLALAGGGCNEAVAPGTYTLTPVVPALAVETCAIGAELVVDEPVSTPAASGDPRACTSDDECVVYCPSAPGCCSSSACGCRGAVHRGRQADADAEYARSCTKSPDCPAMACAWDEARGAACRQGRCVATDGF